jgi:hypothetical protein
MRRFAFLVLLALIMGAVPAGAQRVNEPLFDVFNFKFEASWVGTSTTIRLDSEELGEGTTLSFEDDLGLPDKEAVPSLSFEWQFGRRHRLGVRWQDVKRDSTTQVLEEIDWGGEIIPIEADVTLGFDIRTLAVDYTYYPWVKERWAGGVGLGFRVMGLKTSLTVDDTELEEQINGTAPLPYINFEYRRILGERWRIKAHGGSARPSITPTSTWTGKTSMASAMTSSRLSSTSTSTTSVSTSGFAGNRRKARDSGLGFRVWHFRQFDLIRGISSLGS